MVEIQNQKKEDGDKQSDTLRLGLSKKLKQNAYEPMTNNSTITYNGIIYHYIHPSVHG